MTQAKAIRIFETGGPEVMQYVDVDVPAPGPGEATIKQHACLLYTSDAADE